MTKLTEAPVALVNDDVFRSALLAERASKLECDTRGIWLSPWESVEPLRATI